MFHGGPRSGRPPVELAPGAAQGADPLRANVLRSNYRALNSADAMTMADYSRLWAGSFVYTTDAGVGRCGAEPVY